MSDSEIEKMIVDKGLTAPRVTPGDIEANISEEHYFTGDAGHDAVRFSWLFADHEDPLELAAARELQERASVMSLSAIRTDIDIAMGRDGNKWSFDSLGLLTYCTLVLQNGFTVTGESACASPENFDAEVGRKIARQNAINKIWPLMGYELKQRIFEAS
ncbi:Gp49 family protein [Methylomonas sp. 11b]|uniref:Gp49 family protein n=1 Tax=Methylomonas sp. 11b TaxID=1168169 RepID=UPI0004786A82|nr:Gp49 family protein [Methylomonas sp. 11b]